MIFSAVYFADIHPIQVTSASLGKSWVQLAIKLHTPSACMINLIVYISFALFQTRKACKNKTDIILDKRYSMNGAKLLI